MRCAALAAVLVAIATCASCSTPSAAQPTSAMAGAEVVLLEVKMTPVVLPPTALKTIGVTAEYVLAYSERLYWAMQEEPNATLPLHVESRLLATQQKDGSTDYDQDRRRSLPSNWESQMVSGFLSAIESSVTSTLLNLLTDHLYGCLSGAYHIVLEIYQGAQSYINTGSSGLNGWQVASQLASTIGNCLQFVSTVAPGLDWLKPIIDVVDAIAHAASLEANCGPAISDIEGMIDGSQSLNMYNVGATFGSCAITVLSDARRRRDVTTPGAEPAGTTPKAVDPTASTTTTTTTTTTTAAGDSLHGGSTTGPLSITPNEWTCNGAYYAAADVCDVGCGAYDPDCSQNLPVLIHRTKHSVPGNWSCASEYYASGASCDKGCGVVDPDCGDTTLPVYDWSTRPVWFSERLMSLSGASASASSSGSSGSSDSHRTTIVVLSTALGAALIALVVAVVQLRREHGRRTVRGAEYVLM